MLGLAVLLKTKLKAQEDDIACLPFFLCLNSLKKACLLTKSLPHVLGTLILKHFSKEGGRLLTVLSLQSLIFVPLLSEVVVLKHLKAGGGGEGDEDYLANQSRLSRLTIEANG